MSLYKPRFSWYPVYFLGGVSLFIDIRQRTANFDSFMITNSQRASAFPLLSCECPRFSPDTICTMESHHRRKLSIDRASVEAILTSGAALAAGPPSPHVGTSPNRASFPMAPPSQPAIRHSRALSYTPRKPNRLSLTFPIASSVNSNESARPTPTSSNATSFPATPADVPAASPNDPSGFLVALAGQERRVLELKEELEKAEADLAKLKKQWAVHEAYKKRSEIRHVEQLQPLQTVVTDGVSTEEPTIASRHSIELDRRRSLLNHLNLPKESRRKFSGRHTRTLSLLSPNRANYPQPFPFPPVKESGAESSGVPRSTTMPDTSQGITKINSNRARHSYQAGVTHNAKQIAEDVKAGLWTFLEDLRQATVGEEAVNGTTNRARLDAPRKGPTKKGSKSSLLSNERGKRGVSPNGSPTPRTWDSLTGNSPVLDAAGTVWPDMDQSRPLPKTPSAAKQKQSRPISLAAPVLDDLDDGWSNWDSPTPKSPRWSGSTTISEDLPTPSNASIDDRAVK